MQSAARGVGLIFLHLVTYEVVKSIEEREQIPRIARVPGVGWQGHPGGQWGMTFLGVMCCFHLFSLVVVRYKLCMRLTAWTDPGGFLTLQVCYLACEDGGRKAAARVRCEEGYRRGDERSTRLACRAALLT